MKILATTNISKDFATWLEMHEGLNPEMEILGMKLIWAGTNPDESKVFVLMCTPSAEVGQNSLMA